MTDISTFLAENDIEFERFDHVPVFTCEESEKLPSMPGTSTKNLFLTEKKGDRFFLVTVGHGKKVDLKALKEQLQCGSLSFGSEEKLKELLGVTPGSATLLGLVFDTEHKVEVIIDHVLWKADALQCHPLTNSATMSIPHAGIEKFLQATGHEVRVMDVPEKKNI